MAKKIEEDKFRFVTEQHVPVDSPEAPDGGEKGRKIIEGIKKKGGKIRDLDTHAVYVTQERTFLERMAGKDPLQPVPKANILAEHNADQAKNRESLVRLQTLLEPILESTAPIVAAYETTLEATLKKQFSDPAKAASFKTDEPKIYALAKTQLQQQIGERNPIYAQLEIMKGAQAALKTAITATAEALADKGAENGEKPLKNLYKHMQELKKAVSILAKTATTDTQKLPKALESQIKNILSASSLIAKEDKAPTMKPEDYTNILRYMDSGSFEMREMLKIENAGPPAKG